MFASRFDTTSPSFSRRAEVGQRAGREPRHGSKLLTPQHMGHADEYPQLDWVPAFAGMTLVKEQTPSDITSDKEGQ